MQMRLLGRQVVDGQGSEIMQRHRAVGRIDADCSERRPGVDEPEQISGAGDYGPHVDGRRGAGVMTARVSEGENGGAGEGLMALFGLRQVLLK